MAETSPLPTPPPPVRAGMGVAMGQALRRLRLALLLAFAVLALAVLVLGDQLLRLDSSRAADSDLMARAATQHTLSQQIGREAALLVVEPVERGRSVPALGLLLKQARDEALALEGLLARQQDLADAGTDVRAALPAWQAARDRLWSRTDALLRQASVGAGSELLADVLAVQAEVVPALAAAQRLSAALRRAAERRADLQQRAQRLGTAAVLLVLLLLALAVVAPGMRALRRHAVVLQERATALQRLALVAERTSALVLISDRDDRVVWVNDAFTQAAGWPLADAAGHRPGVLLDSPHADAKVLARVQAAVQQGRGAHHEWLHRTRDGADLWLDVDL